MGGPALLETGGGCHGPRPPDAGGNGGVAGVRAHVLQRPVRRLLRPASGHAGRVAAGGCRARPGGQRAVHGPPGGVQRHHAARRCGPWPPAGRAAFRRWLVVTVVLAAAFLANQAHEWLTLDFSVSSHPYGSAFYVMTGFHGLHVAGGMLAMLVLVGRAVVAPLRAGRDAGGRDRVLLLAFRRRGLGGAVGHPLPARMSPVRLRGWRWRWRWLGLAGRSTAWRRSAAGGPAGADRRPTRPPPDRPTAPAERSPVGPAPLFEVACTTCHGPEGEGTRPGARRWWAWGRRRPTST